MLLWVNTADRGLCRHSKQPLLPPYFRDENTWPVGRFHEWSHKLSEGSMYSTQSPRPLSDDGFCVSGIVLMSPMALGFPLFSLWCSFEKVPWASLHTAGIALWPPLQSQKAETGCCQDNLYFTCLRLHHRLRLKVSGGCSAFFGVSLAFCC